MLSQRNVVWPAAFIVSWCLLVGSAASSAQTIVSDLAAGANPVAAATDPVLGKTYIVNQNSNTVTAINEFTNSTSTIAVGSSPSSIAVDPNTGVLYVANEGDGTVTAISGETNAALATVTTGHAPIALAVNSVSNQVFVVNRDNDTMTIIDGATLKTSTVAVGSAPVAVAVNPVDDSVYVANQKSNSLTIINGKTSVTTTVPVGTMPASVAVNPTTDIVYVVNEGDDTITALNRNTSSTAAIPVGSTPASIAIDPLTNRIYVPSSAGSTISVIDGATNAVSTVTVGVHPLAVAVNTLTDTIYVANDESGQTATGSNLLSVIDGTTNTVTEVAGSGGSAAIALDPRANRIYIPDTASDAVVAIAGATNTTKSIPAGVTGTPNTYPGNGIAYNPATGVIFLCDGNANSLILIDTASDTTTAVPVGIGPAWVAVNPVTNMAYVVNAYDNKVSVVDGSTRTVVASISVPYLDGASAIAVNPVTDKIYVAAGDANQVIVIDGATDETTVVPVGGYPISLVVNPVTNKTYVVNENGGTISILDGATSAVTATLSIPVGVSQIVANPNTNTLYMPAPANAGLGAALLVLNGATNQIATVTLAKSDSLAQQIAVNLQTNRVYVDWQQTGSASADSSIAVIDGATNQVVDVTTVPLAAGAITAVDPLSNQVYASLGDGSTSNPYSVLAIDGATDAFATIPLQNAAGYMAVNPVSGKVYFGAGDASVGVITPNALQQIPLTMNVSGVTDDQTISTTNLFQTANPSPTFTAQVTSSYTSVSGSGLTVDPPPTAVYYQVDGGAYSWTRATPANAAGSNPATFNVCLTNIPVGLHTLYLFPAYGDESAGSGAGNGTAGAVQVGNVQGVPFLIAPGGTSSGDSSASCASSQPGSGAANTTSITVASSTNPQVLGSSVTFTATVAPLGSESGTPSGTVSFYDGTTKLGSTTLGSNLTATYTTSSLALGSHSITAAYSGDSSFAGSASGVLVESIVAPTTISTSTTLSSSANPQVVGNDVTFTATVTPSSGGSGSPTGTVTFYDGTTELGAASLGANLGASFTTSSLTQGTHAIMASYSGNAAFAASTSPVLTESITASATAGDFTIAANPSALTLLSGASGSITVTVAPVSGFSGTVNLSCGNLPAFLSCSFLSQTLTLTGGASQSTTLTVSVPSFSSQLQNELDTGHGVGGRLLALCFLFPGLGTGVLLIAPVRRRRFRVRVLVVVATLLGAALTLEGCGVTYRGYAGTYQFVVTGKANGGQSHQTDVTVMIQNSES